MGTHENNNDAIPLHGASVLLGRRQIWNEVVHGLHLAKAELVRQLWTRHFKSGGGKILPGLCDVQRSASAVQSMSVVASTIGGLGPRRRRRPRELRLIILRHCLPRSTPGARGRTVEASHLSG